MVTYRRKRQTAENYNVLGGKRMEWIIFVDLGFIVFLIVMAAILAAVGTAGAVMWIWPAIKIIVGVLFAIVMVV